MCSSDLDTVTGSHGITVTADALLEKIDLSKAEMIVLPGGGTGVKNLGAEPAVERLVRQAADQNIWVAAICAAPTLLGRWGLLEGKHAVCFPGMEDGLTGARAQMDQRVVADGKLITGRAAGSAFDFGLALVEALKGKDEAGKAREAIHY